MTISLKHAFTSAKADGTDPTRVQPSNWNAEHTITCAQDKVLGRSSSGTGPVEEIAATSFGRSLLAAANAAAAALLLPPFPSGTKMLFVQTSAPTGWTKDTTHNNKALRVVSGTASSGGTTAFTSVFTSRTITEANLPSHTHSVTDPGHTHTTTFETRNDMAAGGSNEAMMDPINNINVGSTSYTSASNTTGITIGNTGSGTAMDFAVQYVDVIIATKD